MRATARIEEFDAAAIAKVADLIEAERTRNGITTPERAEDVAAIIVALFHGMNLMRGLKVEGLDESFLETVITFLARALVSVPE